MIVADTSGLIAALLASQPEHASVVGALAAEEPPYLLSPFVLAEVDYFLIRWGGVDAELTFLDDVAQGAYQLESFSESDIGAAHGVVAQYRALRIGLADASIVVLTERHRTDRVLTLDERHFRALRPRAGGAFTLLPADAGA